MLININNIDNNIDNNSNNDNENANSENDDNENDTNNNDDNKNNNINNLKLDKVNIEEIFEFEKQQKKKNTDNIITSWTSIREKLVKEWIKELEFYQIITYFYLFQIKRIENLWTWLIIVLSTIVSTISLLQFDKDENDADLVLGINITVTILTTLITLIASWMKIQHYVGTISECEKYLQSLSIVLSELNGQIKISREDRVVFDKFLEKYKDKVIQFSSSMPLISPYDWKYTIYLLTKYYPELIQDIYPWNDEPDFGKLILLTYHKVKYRTLFRRLISGYYCYSSCCKHEEENIKDIKTYFRRKREIEKLKEEDVLQNLEEELIEKKHKKNINRIPRLLTEV